MKLFAIWLSIVVLVDTLMIEFNDVSCSTSTKRSAEITNCQFKGRYVSFNVNFFRTLDNWKVKVI